MKIDEFESIFHEYKNWVYKTAFLIVRDHHKAEDIMQEVFISVYKSSNTYEAQKGSYKNWLRSITVHQCFRNNSKKSPKLISMEEYEEDNPAIADNCQPIPDQLSVRDDMHRLLESVSEKYRAALLLRYYEGLSYEEIATTLKIPLGTVKSRISAAVLKLRNTQKRLEKGPIL